MRLSSLFTLFFKMQKNPGTYGHLTFNLSQPLYCITYTTPQRNLSHHLKSLPAIFLIKQSKTVNLPAMENGLSLIPSQDYIFCLEPVMLTMKKKTPTNSKICTSIRSYPAVEPKKAVNQWVPSSIQSVTMPFKTVKSNHHDHRVEAFFSHMPQVSRLDSRHEVSLSSDTLY